MKVVPAIDLVGGRCVRLTEGRFDSVKEYDGDPLDVALRWEAEGAQLLHVVDLDGARGGERTDHWRLVERLVARLAIPVQFGGGVRSPDDIRQLLDLGLSRVVIGTLAVADPEAVADFLRMEAERLAIGIDARDGLVQVRGWEQASAVKATELAKDLAGRGARRVIYTDISRDGTLTGPNLEATRAMARAGGIAVTASGGIGSLADLVALRDLEREGVDEVIVGKALYEGRFTLADAIVAATAQMLPHSEALEFPPHAKTSEPAAEGQQPQRDRA